MSFAKKKLGILTIHRHENDGSVMQAYCLQELLRGLLPRWNVFILNVYPTGHALNPRWVLREIVSGKMDMSDAIYHLRRLGSYDSFYRRRYHRSRPQLVTNDSKSLASYVDKGGFDAVVVGSDTVWELGNTWSGLPVPPNYFFLPDVAPSIKKLAFAGSADPLPEVLPIDLRIAEIVGAVQDFDFVSVRDTATKHFFERAGVPEAKLNFMPDPTLLTEFGQLIPNTKLGLEKAKSAGVAILNPVLRKAATQTLRSFGFGVINMVGRSPEADWDQGERLSVEERIGVYKGISLLLTDRFHGSIFTLRLNQCRTPVIVFEDPDKWPLPNSKCRDLFQRLGIEEFVLRRNVPNVGAEEVRFALEQWNDEVVAKVSSRLEGLAHSAKPGLRLLQEVLS